MKHSDGRKYSGDRRQEEREESEVHFMRGEYAEDTWGEVERGPQKCALWIPTPGG